MKLKYLTLALLGTAFLALCGCGNDTSDRFFSLPSDPPDTFIEAKFDGYGGSNYLASLGYLPGPRSMNLTILGSGATALRLELSQGEFEIYELQLAEEDLGELFDLVLESGLMEHDPARTKKADVHKIGNLNYRRQNGVGPALTVHVLETNCPGREPGSSVTATVQVPAPEAGYQHRDSAIATLAELGERLAEIRAKASSQGTRFMHLSD